MFAEFVWPYGRSAKAPTLEILSVNPSVNTQTRSTPMVFVHGAFVGAWCWQEHFLGYFADRGYRAIAPSLRGHGQSESGGALSHAGIGEYVRDLERVTADLAGPPPILIGHSMGALVVQRYLERHPASAAILLAPVPPQGLMPSTLRMMMGDPLLMAQFGLMQTLGSGMADAELARRAVFSDRMAPEDLQRFAHRVQPESQRALWEMSMHGAARPWLVDAKPPVRVIAGEKDALFSESETRLTAGLWEADWHAIPGMAHAMMLEPGWETVAEEMIRGLWASGV